MSYAQTSHSDCSSIWNSIIKDKIVGYELDNKCCVEFVLSNNSFEILLKYTTSLAIPSERS